MNRARGVRGKGGRSYSDAAHREVAGVELATVDVVRWRNVDGARRGRGGRRGRRRWWSGPELEVPVIGAVEVDGGLSVQS